MPRRQKKYHYMYKTTNVINGKFYVGMHSTDDLNDGYLGSGKYLKRSVRKYGEENFKIEFLEFFDDRKKLIEREKELVNDDMLKEALCMNLMKGGTGGLFSAEHHLKMRKGAKNFTTNQWLNADYRNNQIKILSNAVKLNHKYNKYKYDTFLGKTHTDKTKEKIGITNSIKQRGERNSQFGTCWITKDNINKKIKKEYLATYLKSGWLKGRNL